MKVGERGQVTIPKEIRERFDIGPDTQVEFQVADDVIILRKAAKPLGIRKWKGKCLHSFQELGYKSVDKFLEDVRGR